MGVLLRHLGRGGVVDRELMFESMLYYTHIEVRKAHGAHILEVCREHCYKYTETDLWCFAMHHLLLSKTVTPFLLIKSIDSMIKLNLYSDNLT